MSAGIAGTNGLKINSTANTTKAVVLTGANTFTGNVTVNQGVLRAQNASALGASTNNV